MADILKKAHFRLFWPCELGHFTSWQTSRCNIRITGRTLFLVCIPSITKYAKWGLSFSLSVLQGSPSPTGKIRQDGGSTFLYALSLTDNCTNWAASAFLLRCPSHADITLENGLLPRLSWECFSLYVGVPFTCYSEASLSISINGVPQLVCLMQLILYVAAVTIGTYHIGLSLVFQMACIVQLIS